MQPNVMHRKLIEKFARNVTQHHAMIRNSVMPRNVLMFAILRSATHWYRGPVSRDAARRVQNQTVTTPNTQSVEE